MRLRFLLPLLAGAIVLALLLPDALEAQTLQWKIPIYIQNNTNRDTLWFGYHPNATGCIEPAPGPIMGFGCDTIQEVENPPKPFDDVFYAYWPLSSPGEAGTRCAGSQGSRYDIHPYPFPAAPTRQDTSFFLFVNSKIGFDTVTISWPANLSRFVPSMQLRLLTPSTTVDMLAQQSVTVVTDRANGTPYTQGRILVPSTTLKNFVPDPGTPAITYPVDKTTGIPLDTTFTWGAVAGILSYHFQVATDAGFNTIIADKETTGTGVRIKLPKGATDYYWRVSARNEFMRGCPATAKVTTKVTTPDIPIRLLPAANATNVATPVRFTWTKETTATSYHILVSTNNFVSTVKDSALVDTTAVFNLDHCLTYQWRVAALNANGSSGYDTTNRRSFSTTSAVPGPPALLLPAENATGIDAQPTLTWSGDACSQTYHLQVATDSAFTALVADEDVAGTSKQLNPLLGETNYYWHVSAKNPSSGAGLYAAFRKFTTKVLPPSAPALIAPVAGAHVADLAPVLSWHKSFNNPVTYHVQVDTNPSFTHLIYNDSTITDTTFTAAGLQNCTRYFWRVQGKNSVGAGQYATPGDFFTPLVVPGTPALGLPADNATAQPVSVTLTWSSADPCSKQFIVLVALDNAFSAVTVRETLWTTSRVLNNLPGETDFFWKVASYNPAGPSAFSDTRKFTTGIFQPTVPVVLAPADNATLNPDAVEFKWRLSANKPRTYNLQIDTSKAGNFAGTLYKNLTVSDTSVIVNDLVHCWTTFAWRVNATNPAGTTAFSSVRKFQTQRQLAGAPTMLFPADRQDSVQDRPVLTWVGDPCSQIFIVQVSEDSNFTTLFFSDSLTALQTRLPSLKSRTTYFWRVFARNELGRGPANVFRFRSSSATPPDPPVRLEPTNGQTKVLLNPIMRWDSTERAESYRVQVALDTAFSILVVDDSTLVGLSKQVGPLQNSTTYFWRISASNIVGHGKWSDRWSFSTLAPPVAPTLITPKNESTYVAVQPVFNWSLSDGALSYIIEVASDSEFHHIVLADSVGGNPPTTTRQFSTALTGWTNYYWRVHAWNLAGPGPYSPVNVFKTSPSGTPAFMIPVAISETGPMHDTLFFGVDGRATFGIDPRLYEFELPPPSFGVFDARFVDIDSRPGLLGQGLRVNRLPFRDYKQVDSMKITFQPGSGSYPMLLEWNPSYVRDVCDSMLLVDEFGGARIRVRMDSISSCSVTTTGISSLYIIQWGARMQNSILGVDERRLQAAALPRDFQLYQNYPNPFNPSTHVSYSTQYSANVHLAVYDMLGRQVALLADGAVAPGLHEQVWNGMSDQGMQMPSGVYYVRVMLTRIGGDGGANDRFTSMRKMLMIK